MNEPQTPKRRSPGSAERDSKALDAIAAILNEPLTCRRSQLAEIDRTSIERIGEILADTGRTLA